MSTNISSITETTPEGFTPEGVLLTNAVATPAEAVAADSNVAAKSTFAALHLHADLQLALDDLGYVTPTPVQFAVFGPVSSGKDLMVQSRTGTGKTTAFGLPIVNAVHTDLTGVQSLVLAPTRELAIQVAKELGFLGKHRGIKVEAIYGGAPIGKQIANLQEGVHIVVGTPGRILDHLARKTLDVSHLRTFVLDECDEMLSMGFFEDIERITKQLPKKHQTLLFSATMPDEVSRYAKRYMQTPETISLSGDNIGVANITHQYYVISGIARMRDLLKVLFKENPESAIIFCNLRDETTAVARFLRKQGLDAEAISSDLSQAERERVMERMRQHNLRFLVATDVAARGIDISNLSLVVNYAFPDSPDVYVHRTGRTGRAGKHGTAVSLIGPKELGSFWYLKLQHKIKPQELALPADDILEGKLPAPLPPVYAQPRDAMSTLRRTLLGEPQAEYRTVAQRILADSDAERLVALLVGERIERQKSKAAVRDDAGQERGEESRGYGRDARGSRGDRPGFADRGERSDRGERNDRGPREDRPRFDRPERGERHDRGERNDRPDRTHQRHATADAASTPAQGATAPAPVAASGEQRFSGRISRVSSPSVSTSQAAASTAPRDDHAARQTTQDRPGNAERKPEGQQQQRDARGPRDEQRPHHQGRDRNEQRPKRNDRHDHGDRHDRGARNDQRHDRRNDQRNGAAHQDKQPDKQQGGGRSAQVAAAAKAIDRDIAAAIQPRNADNAPPAREFWETWAEDKNANPTAAKKQPAATAEAKKATAAPVPAPTPGVTADTNKKGGKSAKESTSAATNKKSAKPAGKEPAKATASEAAKDASKEAKRLTGKKEMARPAAAPRAAKGAAKSEAPRATIGSPSRIVVNVGKAQGMTADTIRDLVRELAGDKSADIGSVMLRDDSAVIRVNDSVAATLLKKPGKKKVKGVAVAFTA